MVKSSSSGYQDRRRLQNTGPSASSRMAPTVVVGDGVAQFAEQILAHCRVQGVAFFRGGQGDAAQASVLFDAQVHSVSTSRCSRWP